MRIAFVTTEFVTEPDSFDGGLSNYLYRMASALLGFNHQPILIISANESKVFYYNQIEIHRVFVPKRKVKSQKWIEQSFLLKTYIELLHKNTHIDIVQYSSYCGTGFFRSFEIPSITRISSFHPLITKYYDQANDDENKKLQAIEKFALLKSDRIYGPSHKIASIVSQEYNLNSSVIEPPYLKDESKTNYSVFNNSSLKSPYLLFFGTIGLLKGCKVIADILPSFFELYPTHQFCFIGKDSGFEDKKMMDYIFEKAGLFKDRIIYFDRLTHTNLFPFIENAECIVLPSRIDNFPNTCIESMAMGKIVIGTLNTGFDQLIQNNHSGFLCESDNSTSLLSTIIKVIGLSKKEKERIIQNALARIELLNPKIAIQELLDLIDEVKNKSTKTCIDTFDQREYDNLILSYIDQEKSDFINLENHNNDLKNHIQKVYNSKSYKLGNKIVFLLKFQFLAWKRT